MAEFKGKIDQLTMGGFNMSLSKPLFNNKSITFNMFEPINVALNFI